MKLRLRHGEPADCQIIAMESGRVPTEAGNMRVGADEHLQNETRFRVLKAVCVKRVALAAVGKPTIAIDCPKGIHAVGLVNQQFSRKMNCRWGNRANC